MFLLSVCVNLDMYACSLLNVSLLCMSWVVHELCREVCWWKLWMSKVGLHQTALTCHSFTGKHGLSATLKIALVCIRLP